MAAMQAVSLPPHGPATLLPIELDSGTNEDAWYGRWATSPWPGELPHDLSESNTNDEE
jgi:hypothetical protein